METLLINAGPVQRVTENGRAYLVADATILVGDQVLNGSKGKLFYSSRRCALNVGEWNKQPIVIYHPTRNGQPVAAHTREGKLNPEILREFGVGEVRNDSWDGKNRRVKLWFDEEHTRNKSPETYSRLNRGDSIELSTGLFTVDKPVANGRTAAGDDYTHEVEDWVPDHLAILPDQVGACSRRMGCGVNNAEKSCCDGKTSEESCDDCKSKTCETKKPLSPTGDKSGKETTVNRSQIIKDLTTNCACWKGQEKTLNAMEDDALAILAEQAKEMTENQLVVNSVRELLGDEELTANAMPPALAAAIAKKKGETPDGEEEEAPVEEEEEMKKPVGNKLRPAHERLTPDEIETLNIAKSITDKAKRTLVDRVVTANSASAAAAKTIRPLYESMSFKDLEKLVSALPTPAQRRPTNNQEEEDTILDFSGFGFAATTNSRDDHGADVGDDDMAPITFNESLYKTNLTPAK